MPLMARDKNVQVGDPAANARAVKRRRKANTTKCIKNSKSPSVQSKVCSHIFQSTQRDRRQPWHDCHDGQRGIKHSGRHSNQQQSSIGTRGHSYIPHWMLMQRGTICCQRKLSQRLGSGQKLHGQRVPPCPKALERGRAATTAPQRPRAWPQ